MNVININPIIYVVLYKRYVIIVVIGTTSTGTKTHTHIAEFFHILNSKVISAHHMTKGIVIA